jgi:hypothetical protein
MISLSCTHCRAALSIDDAFAGGVCRCQHCGTIQTVPSQLKRRSATPGSAAPVGATDRASAGNGQPNAQVTPAPKALYKRKSRADGTGLDELAEIVASSGLSGSGLAGSGLTSSRLRRDSPEDPSGARDPRSLTVLLAIAGIVIVGLLALVLWLSVGRGPARPTAAADNTAPRAAEPSEQPSVDLAPAVPSRYAEPNFCGTKLDAPVVIYALDRGHGTREVFDTLKEATYRSIGSLGDDRKFQIVFWNNGSDESYPSGQPAYATKENIASCRRALEDTAAFNQSDAVPALTKAMNNRAGEIILATGKGSELEPSLLEQVLALRKGGATKIHTFALGTSDSPVLRQIAQRTGAQYKTVPPDTLREYAE